MNLKLKITTVGNSAGVVLPKEMLAKLRVAKGDHLYVTETPDGFKIVPHDQELEERIRVAESVMRENREVLKRLAKN